MRSERRRALSVAFAFALACCTSSSRIYDSPIDQVKQVIAEHERLSRLGDLNAVMTNMAEDIVVLVNGVPLVKGKAAVRDFYAGYFKAGTLEFGHEYEGAEVVSDTVVLHGVARGRFTPIGAAKRIR